MPNACLKKRGQLIAGDLSKSPHAGREPGVGYGPRHTVLSSGIHLEEVKIELERNGGILQRCWRPCL